jgi:hypothetical protein
MIASPMAITLRNRKLGRKPPRSHERSVNTPRTGHPCRDLTAKSRLMRPRPGSTVREMLADNGSSAAHRSTHSSAPVEIPEEIFERVSTLCRALPEVTVRSDASRIRTRSTAHSFDIPRRSFCLLVATESPTGNPVPLLVLRAEFDERDALLAIGHPFFAPRAGPGRIGVLLTKNTDWEEIRELLTESYRILAPKKLIALLEQ